MRADLEARARHAVYWDREDRGLVFLGLNADLERQFEFIQQNWINNTAFAGLSDERDPLVEVDELRQAHDR